MSLEIRADNTQLYGKELQAAILRALEQIGQAAEGYAKDLCPVDTGNLRNSITHVVDEADEAVYIGSNTSYAPFVELGTGIYNPEGRQTPWWYQDENGKWHWTRGAQAQPFLKPAATDHGQTYRNILEDELKNG